MPEEFAHIVVEYRNEVPYFLSAYKTYEDAYDEVQTWDRRAAQRGIKSGTFTIVTLLLQ